MEMKDFTDDKTPPYAILSHKWDEQEVTFQDMVEGRAQGKVGYEKVQNFCSMAAAKKYEHVWMDTCCIDKTNSVELSEAINSMYRWYQEAEVCYAHLAEIPSTVPDWASGRRAPLSKCKWFERGWTLQELLAPSRVIFVNQAWEVIGDKDSLQLEISEITGIPVEILQDRDFESVSVAQKMSWAAKRKTLRPEDRAYSLLGIFGINMPLIYGEGERAFIRLQEEIIKVTDDHSIFAWKSPRQNHGGLLATSPDAFEESNDIVVVHSPFSAFSDPFTLSNRGIRLEVRLMGTDHSGIGLATLPCAKKEKKDSLIGIYLEDVSLKMECFKRVRCDKLETVNPNVFSPIRSATRSIYVRQPRVGSGKKDLPKPDWTSFDMLLELSTSGDWMRGGKDTVPRDERGQTALSDAARRGDVEKVWLRLVRKEIEADLPDPEGRTPLSHAAGRGHAAVVWLLLTRKDVRAHSQDRNGLTPLSHAAREGRQDVVEMFMSQKDFSNHCIDDRGRTLLSHAAECGHETLIKMFLTRTDMQPDSKNAGDRTPLSFAAANGHEAVVKLLLECGAEADSSDKTGRTPLSFAAANGSEAIVQLLLDFEADVNQATIHSDHLISTPLLTAATDGYAAIVKLLLEHGADIHSDTLFRAAQNGHYAVVKLLLEHGADINSNLPLLYAASDGHEAIVKLLIEYGAYIYSIWPLLRAAKNGHEAVVKLLLEHGADVDMHLPLIFAAENGHEAVVEALVECDRARKVRSKSIRDGIALAAKYGHEAVVKLLGEHGRRHTFAQRIERRK